MKGIIISIEGTDGSGKHTQQQLLSEDLKKLGYSVFNQSFPNYDSSSSAPVKMFLNGDFGNESNGLDAYQASALYAVDRLCTYKKDVKSHYENGEIVLFDRYVQSNLIHQCSRIEDEVEKDKYSAWIDDLEFKKFALPRPDLIFFIEMPVEKSMELARARASYKNGENTDILEENTEYMKKAYNNGVSLAKKYGWTLIHCTDKNGEIKRIEEIHREIMEMTLKFLEENYQNNAEN